MTGQVGKERVMVRDRFVVTPAFPCSCLAPPFFLRCCLICEICVICG
jgi:hypothetical protein